LLKQQQQFFVALLGVVDGLVVAVACIVAWAVRRELVEGFFPNGNWESWVKGPLVIFAVPLVLVTMWAFGLYRPRRDRTLWSEQGQIAKSALLSVGAMIVVLWAIGNQTVSGERPVTAHLFGHVVEGGRVQLIALAAILPVFLGLERASFRLALRQLRKRGRNLRHVAIIGVGRLGQICQRTLSRNSWTGIHIAYFVSHHAKARNPLCYGVPVRGGLDELEETLNEHRVDAVYLALPNAQAAAIPAILSKLEKYAVDVRIVPDVHPRFVPQGMVVNELDGMPILSYRECPSSGLGGVTKRALDIVGSAAAMTIFAPLFALIALAIRLSSPGPVIFKQKRVSLGNQVFKIYKFRTMYHVQDEETAAWAHLKNDWTQRDDPRITPIGRWLRRTSLDELPQLLNVFKGQMSLVGPRPERPELIERFREDWRGYMLRQHVKAGMTGWAQVNGLRGDTSLRKRIQYDLFYVRHWSLLFDLRILWLTVFRGFVHRNAH
jgi:Undecaprenyl-phosphate glucose phosphotransferase